MSELIKGPREPTRKPSLVAPKGTCDCHFHIFGDAGRYPFTRQRSYTPGRSDENDYRKMATAVGIERMVIVQASVYGTDNSCVVDAIANFGADRARGICSVTADVGEAELRRLDEAGVRGARFISFVKGGAALDDLKAIARKIAPFGWHIPMYVASETWHELEATIMDLPVPVIADHMGRVLADAGPNDPGLNSVLRLLDAGKAFVKLSAPYRNTIAGTPYGDVGWVARSYVEHAPERCLWATDWPHPEPPGGYMPDDGDMFDLLCDWAPDAATRNRILVDTPADLYGFEGSIGFISREPSS